MCLIYINLVIAAITIVLVILMDIEYTHRFKRRYPDLNIPESSKAGKIASIFKVVIASLIPVINLGLLWALVFNSSSLEDEVIEYIYGQCKKEPHIGSETCVSCGEDIPEGRQVCPGCEKRADKEDVR